MLFLFVVMFVAGYAVAASRALRHGQGRLWLTAVGALLFIAVGSVLLGRFYRVPSVGRLLLYAGTLLGPVVFITTTMLSFAAGRLSPGKALLTAIAGACLGLTCGFATAVFWLSMVSLPG
jgi:hypothetical protein